MRGEQRDIPRALSLTCINEMIPTNKTKSPLQNYVHILLMHMTISVLLKSKSFHILHLPLLEYNDGILSITIQSKSILNGLAET